MTIEQQINFSDHPQLEIARVELENLAKSVGIVQKLTWDLRTHSSLDEDNDDFQGGVMQMGGHFNADGTFHFFEQQLNIKVRLGPEVLAEQGILLVAYLMAHEVRHLLQFHVQPHRLFPIHQTWSELHQKVNIQKFSKQQYRTLNELVYTKSPLEKDAVAFSGRFLRYHSGKFGIGEDQPQESNDQLYELPEQLILHISRCVKRLNKTIPSTEEMLTTINKNQQGWDFWDKDDQILLLQKLYKVSELEAKELVEKYTT